MSDDEAVPGRRDDAGAPGLAGRVGRGIRNFLLLSLLAAVALAAIYLLVALNWSYSSGERAGYLRKLSHEGWVCKTWEGEIEMVSLPGSLPEKFNFSVRDATTAEAIRQQMGARVVLSYDQHLPVPSCFAETPYWAARVRRFEE